MIQATLFIIHRKHIDRIPPAQPFKLMWSRPLCPYKCILLKGEIDGSKVAQVRRDGHNDVELGGDWVKEELRRPGACDFGESELGDGKSLGVGPVLEVSGFGEADVAAFPGGSVGEEVGSVWEEMD